MKLEWSSWARIDRDEIFSYIEADNPRVAVAVDERIKAQVEGLLQFPESGRPGRIEGTRELIIGRTPFIVAYRITGEAICILRVLHAARLWPGRLSDK